MCVHVYMYHYYMDVPNQNIYMVHKCYKMTGCILECGQSVHFLLGWCRCWRRCTSGGFIACFSMMCIESGKGE